MAKLTQLPQNIDNQIDRAIKFSSAKVNDDGFWVPRSLITSQWENPESQPVSEDDPRAASFVQYVPTWFVAKNNLWSKLQGSGGF